MLSSLYNCVPTCIPCELKYLKKVQLPKQMYSVLSAFGYKNINRESIMEMYDTLSNRAIMGTEEGKAVVSVRCLFDSIECVDENGKLYSFPLERLDSRVSLSSTDNNGTNAAKNESPKVKKTKLFGNDFIPIRVHPSANPLSNRYYCTVVPSLSDGVGTLSKKLISDLFRNLFSSLS